MRIARNGGSVADGGGFAGGLGFTVAVGFAGRDGAKFVDDLREVFEDVIDVVVGVVAAEAETDGAFGEGLFHVHGGEDVAGFDGACGAGGAAGDADVQAIEEEEDTFGFDAVEGDVGGVGEAWFFGAVAGGVGDVAEGEVFEAIAHGADASVFFFEMFHGEFGGASEADDVGNVLGAAAVAVFLMAADDVGMELGALLNVEEADAFWGMKFVAGESQEIDTEGFDVDL